MKLLKKMIPKAQNSYSLHNVLDGDRGIGQTLDTMNSVVNLYKKSPPLRELAMRIVREVPNQNFAGEAATLQKWVQNKIRYVMDVNGVETLQSPMVTLRLEQGDCDDMAILLATLLQCIGHKTRFRAVGFNGGRLSHVFPETLVGRRWMTMECTKPLAFGEKLKGVTKSMVRHP